MCRRVLWPLFLLCRLCASVDLAALAAQPEVSQTLRQRIAGDSQKLGHVAQRLLSVQSDINRVEKEVTGKVFDLQTVRNFFATHQQVQEENNHLKGDVADLNQEVQGLSTQVATSQAKFDAAANANKAQSAQLESKVAEDEAVIQGLNEELTRSKTVEEENKKIKEINRVLRDEMTKTVQAGQVVYKELNDLKGSLHEHVLQQKSLHDQLVEQHDYGVACHQKVSQLEDQLKAAVAKETAATAATAAAAQQATAAAAAAQQRLNVENLMLKQQLAAVQREKAEAQAQQVQMKQQLVQMQTELSTVQTQAATQLENMKVEMGHLHEHIHTLRDSLEQNVVARRSVDEELSGLKNKFLANGYATLQQKLDQMKIDYDQVTENLQGAQVAEAEAKATAEQATAQQMAFKKAAELNAKAARQAALDAQAQVQAAAQQSSEAQEKAAESTMAAEAAVASKCQTIWDKKHSKTLKKLKKCKVIKSDLQTCEAQVGVLKQAAK